MTSKSPSQTPSVSARAGSETQAAGWRQRNSTGKGTSGGRDRSRSFRDRLELRNSLDGRGKASSDAARKGNSIDDRNAKMASDTARLLVEIEDYESVAIVPQAVQTLSNPLKLLAHASDAVDSASRRGNSASAISPNSMSEDQGGSSKPSGSLKHIQAHSRAPLEQNDLVPLHRRLNQSMEQREAAAWSHFAAANEERSSGSASRPRPEQCSSAGLEEDPQAHIDWSTYFSRGAFHPRYDTGSALDPIERDLLTFEQAQDLLAL